MAMFGERTQGSQSRAGALWSDGVVVGFSLFLVLGSVSGWGLITLVSLSWMGAGEVLLFESLRSVGFLATLFLFGLGCAYLGPVFAVNTATASTLLWAAGYTGMFVLVFAGPDLGFLVGISAVCLGIAHALSFIVWQRVFCLRDGALANRQIVVGSALGGVGYLLVSLIPNAVAYGVALAVLVVGNAWFLGRCARGVFARGTREVHLVLDGGKGVEVRNFLASSWRYAVCIAAVGFVNGVSRTLARLGGADAFVFNILLAVGMFAACLLLLFLWERLHLSFTFNAAYAVIFTAITTGFLFLPFAGQGYRAVFAGLTNLAFTMLSMFMMITCMRLARLRSMDPVAVFGLFAGVVYAGVFAGRLAGGLLGDSLDVLQLLVLALLSVYVLSFSGVVVNAARGAAAAGGFDPICGVDGTAGDVLENLPEKGSARSKDAVVSGAPEDLRGDAADMDDAVAPCGPAGCARPSLMLRRVVVLQDAVPAVCAAIRQAYGLSSREADVLELVVRGRDTAHMAEALFVSENTIRSHCKSMYKKLGVHNRQQVFDLVETFKDAGEGTA